jgi:RNA polymerase sigma-70 factor (ECF subfamily)
MKKFTFKRLVRKYRNRVYSNAFYFLGNQQDAEDVTQDVFVRLWEHMERIDLEKTATWLMRVTHNLCIDLIRKRQISSKALNTIEGIESAYAGGGSTVFRNPGVQLELSNLQKSLLDAMDALPSRTRSMLLLHYFEGMKYEAIGGLLGLKAGAVKTAVHRGRRLLRDTLLEKYTASKEVTK